MAIKLVLFVGRIALVVILYLFLFVVMKTGIGLVKGQRKDSAVWYFEIEKATDDLRGLHVDILGPITVGRGPDNDIVVGDPMVSSRHARFSLQGPALVLEDLGSRNGTKVNHRYIGEPVSLRDGDEIQLGDTIMRVSRQ